jgi:prepilin-type N-terminal cleavage/methylation domain-containing protein|tara:strand:+ start:42 stop:146 length:105 start_codon:yes stop_codon:yes gene_type:complete
MNRKAFTLKELLVVVAIIVILAEDNLMDSKVAIC